MESVKKKLSKKELAKLERERKRQEAATATAIAISALKVYEDDPLADRYGDTPLTDLQSRYISGKVWIEIGMLNCEMKDQVVLVRGRAHLIRSVGKKMTFIVLRKMGLTVQCVLTVATGLVSLQMVKFATRLTRESIVDVEGVVRVPNQAITGASQQVEIIVQKLYCISRAIPTLPITIEDAARSDHEIKKASESGEMFARVNQDTRLNHRVIDLRTAANQGIFRIQSHTEQVFREVLISNGFIGIHTPRLLAGICEGGSTVFQLDYKGKPASLAQSPMLHKQMAICSDFSRVFSVGSCFRAENSSTHKHLCEFVVLNVEMEIKEHYKEIMDIVDTVFVTIFDRLNEQCPKELEAINQQYPFGKLKYLRNTLRLTFEEGVQMLKEAGVEIDPLGDLNTETERKLGQLVLEKYGTEFYFIHRFPLASRPFFTMPCHDNPNYSNSFDVFIRGEEILSGAQRIHNHELLIERAQSCGIDVKDESISSYLDGFRYGVPLHGGFGAGLERVVKLFCALNDIRKTSLFPRDPKRLAP